MASISTTARFWLFVALLTIVGCDQSAAVRDARPDASVADAAAHVVGAAPQYISVNGTSVGVTPGLQFPTCVTDAGNQAYGPVDGGAGLQCVSAGGGGGDAAAQIYSLIGNTSLGQIADLNSVVWGDVSQGEWYQIFPSNTPTIQPAAGNAADGYPDAVLLNASDTSSGFPIAATYFTAPPNVTAMSFEVDASQGPAGSQQFQIQILNSGASSVLATTTVTPTSSMVTYTTGSLTVTPGTAYVARIWFNAVSAPSQAIIGRARVRVLTTTNPLFASPWVRYNASSSLLWDNGHDEIESWYGLGTQPTVGRFQTPMSRFVFDTNASTIGIQVSNVLTTYVSGFSKTVVNVNGRYYTSVTGATGVDDVQTVTLPAGLNRVEIVTSWGDYINTPAVPIWLYTAEQFTRSVMVPLGSTFNVVPPQQTATRVLVFGDSKDSGYAATIPSAQGFPPLLRRLMPTASVAVEGIGSASLYTNMTTTAVRQQTIARLAQYKPTTLLFMHGRNDWFDTYWTSVSVYQSAVGTFLDSFHEALPSCSIVAVSTWLESTGDESSTNGNGETLSQYRTAMSNACAARPQYCQFEDGTSVPGWSQTTSLADGIHPNNQGSWQIAQWIAGPVGWFTVPIELGQGNILWPSSAPSPLITQETPTTDVATTTLTIDAQSAYASAATNTTGGNLVLKPGSGATSNGTPGNVVVNNPAASGSGTEALFLVQRNGTDYAAMGPLIPTSTAYAGFWLHNTPSASNYNLLSDGASTLLNTPSNVGTLYFGIGTVFNEVMTSTGHQIGSSTPSFGGGNFVIGIANGTPPSSSNASGVIVYATGGEFCSRGSNSTITCLPP
jgi:lysophospholipase L1-like esterase